MAVTTRSERADHRRHLSVNAPLFVDWRGQRLRAKSWSLGGLCIAAAERDAPAPGTVERVRVTLPFQGFEMAFEVNGRVVVSAPETGGFDLEFADLGSRERELMCHFLDDLVRGRMSEVEGIIRRIDVPVEPLALTPDTPLAGEAARPPRRASAGMMTALYSIAGLLVFGYLGLLVHGHFFRFESDNAQLTVPAEAMPSLGEGQLQWTALKPGDEVKAGEIIVTVVDNQLEREIELNGIAVREKEARLAILQRRAGGEPLRQSNLATSRSQNAARTRLEIDSLLARVQAAEQEAKRIASLPRSPQNTLRIDEAKKRTLAYQKAAESKQIELKSHLERDLTVPGVRPTQALAQSELMRELSPVELQAAVAEQDLEFAQQRLQALTGHRDRLAARAPFDGVIAALPRADRAVVRKGDVVAVVEQRMAPSVTAYLSTAEALKIGLGDHARVYVPSAGRFFTGTVRAIDKGPPIDQRAGSAAGAPSPSSLTKIDVGLASASTLADRQRYQAGLPVVVQFERRWVPTTVSAGAGERSGQSPELRSWLDRIISRAQARQ